MFISPRSNRRLPEFCKFQACFVPLFLISGLICLPPAPPRPPTPLGASQPSSWSETSSPSPCLLLSSAASSSVPFLLIKLRRARRLGCVRDGVVISSLRSSPHLARSPKCPLSCSFGLYSRMAGSAFSTALLIRRCTLPFHRCKCLLASSPSMSELRESMNSSAGRAPVYRNSLRCCSLSLSWYDLAFH